VQTVALLSTLAATAAAHGRVQGIVADGVWYEGYNPSFQYADPAPVVIGWSDPEDLSNGYIPPSNYSGPDIICHLGATPGGTAATVKAGGTVELQWTAWPSSHQGPVLNYLAKAGDSSTSFDWSGVDKTSLEFVKIDAAGLIDDSTVPGTWASDQLIVNNNSWTLEIPSSIAPGMYVLRHEIIALHSAEESDGAQNYPQCINLEVTGSGTATPSGTLGEKLYTNTAAPGIMVNIYSSLSTYEIPGPTLWSGATATLAQSSVAITGAASVETGSSTAWGASTTASTPTTSQASSAAAATSTAAQSTSTAAASTNNDYASTSTATDIEVATAQVTEAVT
ncbi:glycoside hydrolase family 61 protein, partial [Teratosphaeria nubilosa]